MQKFRPKIRIFWQEGVSRAQIGLLMSTTQEMLDLIGVAEEIKVVYGKSLSLEPYKNTDKKSIVFGRIMADKCISDLSKINYKINSNCYILVATKDPMFYIDNSTPCMVVGIAENNRGGLVWVGDPTYENDPDIIKRIKVTAMHELEHIFSFSIMHCDKKECVMHAYDTSKLVDIEKEPFCVDCLDRLYIYFGVLKSVS